MTTCPACKTRLVHQASQESGVERLLGLFTMYPFRCQLCTHRFLAFLWRYSPSPKREYDRVPAQYPVTLYPATAQTPGEGITGTTVNLSISGGLIETAASVPQGSSLRLTIHPSGPVPHITVDSALVRAIVGNKLALEFFKIAPEEEQRLRVFMEAHLLCRPK